MILFNVTKLIQLFESHNFILPIVWRHTENKMKNQQLDTYFWGETSCWKRCSIFFGVTVHETTAFTPNS